MANWIPNAGISSIEKYQNNHGTSTGNSGTLLRARMPDSKTYRNTLPNSGVLVSWTESVYFSVFAAAG